MTPYEIMLSESQERMLLVSRSATGSSEVLAIFHKWELDAVEIGRVTDSGRVVLFFEGRIVADLPAAPLSDRAPVYDRPRAAARARRPGRFSGRPSPSPPDFGDVPAAAPRLAQRRREVLDLDASTTTWSRRTRSSARAATPRSSASRARRRAIAMKSDVNPVLLLRSIPTAAARSPWPRRRGRSPARARARSPITDCLNFGNPEKPEVMAQFEAAVRGIADACRALEMPVVSGNVSLLQRDRRPRDPADARRSAWSACIEDVEKHVRMPFRKAGDLVALLGETRDELGASEFLRTIRGRDEGPCPEVDLDGREAPRRPARDARRARPARLRARRLRRRPRRRRSPSARCRAASARRSRSTAPRARRALLFGESTGRARRLLRARERGRGARSRAREGRPVLGRRLGRRRPPPHRRPRPAARSTSPSRRSPSSGAAPSRHAIEAADVL